MAFESHPGKTLPPDTNGAEGLNVPARSGKMPILTLKSIANSSAEILDISTPETSNPESAGFVAAHEHVKVQALHPSRHEMQAHRRPPLRYVPSVGVAISVLDTFCMAVVQIGLIDIVRDYIAVDGTLEALALVVICVVPHVLFLHALGGYRREAIAESFVPFGRIGVAIGFGGAVLFSAFCFELLVFPPDGPVLNIGETAVKALVIALASAGLSFCAILAGRTLAYAIRGQAWLRRRILVIGEGQRAAYLRKLMADLSHGTHDLIFVPESVLVGSSGIGSRIAPSSIMESAGKSLDALTRELSIDEVVLASDDRRSLPMQAFLVCKVNGTPVTDYAAFIERETGRVDLNQLDLAWLVYSNGFRLRLVDEFAKRALDIVVSVLLLSISLPVLVGAATLILLEGKGPIFIRQERITKNGRVFGLFKLRTMRCDAEIKGPQWATERDPRITKVGALLRRFRIDELPQLVNVLYGDMSLVGPRPERPIFVDQLSRSIQLYPLRHTFKAGLTGWAQINYPYGASEDDAKKKLEYDLYYIKNYNLIRELSIILQTLRVLFWPPGVR
jgi:sugar transferase (PEP-CTERM system associated)